MCCEPPSRVLHGAPTHHIRHTEFQLSKTHKAEVCLYTCFSLSLSACMSIDLPTLPPSYAKQTHKLAKHTEMTPETRCLI